MKFNKNFTIFQFICLIYFFSFTIIASPISIPEFAPENIEKTQESTSEFLSSSTSLPSAVAIFKNPTNTSTAVTGQITFTQTSQNKTRVSGKIDSGIFDSVVANYQFKIVDRSKTLLYDLTADGLNEWSVNANSSSTTPFQHDFDKLSISKIINQFFEISHHKKGTVGMTIIKESGEK